MLHGLPPPSLFTSADGRHTVRLVVVDGGRDEEAFNKRLGAVLKAMRLTTRNEKTGRPLTQEQAGQLLDRDADVIGRWERGHSLPRIDRLAEVAEGYGVPRERWYLLLEPPALPQPVSPLAAVLGERMVSLNVLSATEDAAAVAGADAAAARSARRGAARLEPGAEPGSDTPSRTGNRGVA